MAKNPAGGMGQVNRFLDIVLEGKALYFVLKAYMLLER